MTKIYIRSKHFEEFPIYCMATPRAKAISMMQGLEDEINEHITKCIVYGNSTDDLDHWISEISEWLYQINQIEVKPNAKKLKESDYSKNAFGCFGDAVKDAGVYLTVFRVKTAKMGDAYPDFTVTSELQNKLFTAWNLFLKTFPPIFATKNNHTKQDFVDEVSHILKGLL